MMKRERLFYLDLIRAFATVIIIITHYNAVFLYLMPEEKDKIIITSRVANLYIGDFGVSLFLIISGASLMYVYQEKLDLKKFVKKRFLGIYPMFWIAYILAFVYMFYNQRTFAVDVPRKNFIFTILGIDGYVSTLKPIGTFYLVGEWFIGLILMMYVVFPILRKLIIKYPIPTAVGIMIMYILSIIFVDRNVELFVRIPEFAFGMYFVRYIKKVKWPAVIVSVVVILYNSFLTPPFNNNIQTTYIGICAFLILVWLADYVKVFWLENICSIISKYSYAIFLVHHFIIFRVTERYNLYELTRLGTVSAFLTCVVFTAAGAFILYQIDKNVRSIFTKKSEKN